MSDDVSGDDDNVGVGGSEKALLVDVDKDGSEERDEIGESGEGPRVNPSVAVGDKAASISRSELHVAQASVDLETK